MALFSGALRLSFTPGTLLLSLSLAMSATLIYIESQAESQLKVLSDQIIDLKGVWTALADSTTHQFDDLATWNRQRSHVIELLQRFTNLETEVVPVTTGLAVLPVRVNDMNGYGQARDWFDRGLDVVEQIRARERRAFLSFVTGVLGLGVIAAGLMVWRTAQLRFQAAGEKENTLLAERRVKVQMNERARIARELHDGVAQDLARARLLLQQTDNETARSPFYMELIAAMDSCLSEIRWLCGTMRNPISTNGNLGSVVARVVEDFHSRFRIPVVVQEISEVPPWQDIDALYEVSRVMQEGLTNVGRHSGASEVNLRYFAAGQVAKIVIEDDGVDLFVS